MLEILNLTNYFRQLHLKLTPPKVLSELYELAYGIHFVFEKHNLTYFLDSGSAVGAIRHKGIIPWDDDLDLVITEEQESLFLTTIRAELLKDKKVKIVNGGSNDIWDYKLVSIYNEQKMFPACDVFVVKHAEARNAYVFRNAYLTSLWPYEFNESLMHPILTNFGTSQMRILPIDAYHWFTNWYGKSWRNVGMTARYDHTHDQHLIPMTFQIPNNMILF